MLITQSEVLLAIAAVAGTTSAKILITNQDGANLRVYGYKPQTAEEVAITIDAAAQKRLAKQAKRITTSKGNLK